MKSLILTSLLALGAWMCCSEKSFAQYFYYSYSSPYAGVQVYPYGGQIYYPYAGPAVAAYGGPMIVPSARPWITYSASSYYDPSYYVAYYPGFGYRRIRYP
ncbi:MAG: hypothetical protein QM703_25495 [Gemmatales bacterium]